MPAAKGSKKKVVIEDTTEIVEAVPAPKKKTAKKPVKVVAVVTADGIDGSFSPEPRRPLIAHLQIRTNEVLFHDNALRYDPNPPSAEGPAPYDAADGDMFTAGQEHVESRQLENPVATPVAATAPVVEVSRSMPCFTRADLMVQFKAPSQERRLPSNTDIACFWCAHTFEGMPCIIPEREVDMIYMVYDGTGRIFPAPARESLKLFGGPMSIDVFRATMHEKKVRVDVHMPPMVSILGSIDTKPIDFFDTNLKQGGAVQVAPQRSVEEGLRLKRSKPLKERESTLDTVMNIKIGGGRRAAT